jgi:hypothetical protein
MIHGTKIYSVSINGGKIDSHKASDYKSFLEDDTYNTASENVEVFKEKAKSLVRFFKVSQALSKGLNQMFDIETTGDDPTTVASSISFKLAYTQADGLWVEVDESEYAEDEEIEKLKDGRVIFKGKKAIEKLIQNALKESTSLVEYFETKASRDSNEVTGTRNSGAPLGWSFEKMTIEETAPAITVEEVISVENEDLTIGE